MNLTCKSWILVWRQLNMKWNEERWGWYGDGERWTFTHPSPCQRTWSFIQSAQAIPLFLGVPFTGGSLSVYQDLLPLCFFHYLFHLSSTFRKGEIGAEITLWSSLFDIIRKVDLTGSIKGKHSRLLYGNVKWRKEITHFQLYSTLNFLALE